MPEDVVKLFYKKACSLSWSSVKLFWKFHYFFLALSQGLHIPDSFEVKLTVKMSIVHGQQHSFSTHERPIALTIWAIRVRYLLFLVFGYWLWRYRHLWSKVNIWNVKCAWHTALILTLGRLSLWKCRNVWDRKCLDMMSTQTSTFGFMPNALTNWAIIFIFGILVRCRLYSELARCSLMKLWIVRYSHWVHWWRPLQPTSSVITDAKSADLNLDDFARKKLSGSAWKFA